LSSQLLTRITTAFYTMVIKCKNHKTLSLDGTGSTGSDSSVGRISDQFQNIVTFCLMTTAEGELS